MLFRIAPVLIALVASILVSVASLAARAQDTCVETPEGRRCTFRPSLANGTLVDVNTQQALGLVTVAGGCSGTLLNRFWVLTADHCVSANGTTGGPANAFENVPITAAWSTRSVTPTQFIRYFQIVQGDIVYPGEDIALIFLGRGDLGPVNVQPLFADVVTTSMTLIKYGAGLSSFATVALPGPPPVPAMPGVADARYRSSRFTPTSADEVAYVLPCTPSPCGPGATGGQVGHGGDSGGPDVVVANGVAVGIAGVQSSCTYSGLVTSSPPAPPPPAPWPPAAPAPFPWRWATGITSCRSVAVNWIRARIQSAIQEGIIPCRYVSAGCAIMEPASILLLN